MGPAKGVIAEGRNVNLDLVCVLGLPYPGPVRGNPGPRDWQDYEERMILTVRQIIGRAVRAPGDRGSVLLIDERFRAKRALLKVPESNWGVIGA